MTQRALRRIMLDLLRNPRPAREVWPYDKLGTFNAEASLAGIHMARLNWRDATEEQIAESKAWLEEHHYEAWMRRKQ